MGTPKALLAFDGKTLLARVLDQLMRAKLEEVICVTGSSADLIESEIHKIQSEVRPRAVRNANYKTGMLSSVQAGLRACSSSSTGAILTLVDLPYLRASDFLDLSTAAPEHLARYRYMDQAAHPVYIPRKYFGEILAAPYQQDGCAFLFRKYAKDVVWLEANSPRGLLDIDTAEDYHAHLSS